MENKDLRLFGEFAGIFAFFLAMLTGIVYLLTRAFAYQECGTIFRIISCVAAGFAIFGIFKGIRVPFNGMKLALGKKYNENVMKNDYKIYENSLWFIVGSVIAEVINIALFF